MKKPKIPLDLSSEETTIKLSKSTKARLEKFKLHPRQTYDELLNKLMNEMDYMLKGGQDDD